MKPAALYRETKGVGLVTINRPKTRNALALEDWRELAELLEEADADPDCHALILASEKPRMFCAGADIRDIADNAGDPEWAEELYEVVRRCNRLLHDSDKPVIAAIDGDCIGGGCGLALACDIRIAHQDARFGITPARLGIAYNRFDTALLVRTVGEAQARRMLLLADIIGAEEALRIGLIHKIADDPVEMAYEVAARIGDLSAHSSAAAKRHIRAIADGRTDDDDETRDAFIESYARPELAERARRFLKRRR